MTLLLVDDDASVVAQTSRLLTSKGFDVRCASTLHGAVEACVTEQRDEQRPVDLILMDIDLGEDNDGIDAAQEILQHRNVPIVFLTAFLDETISQRVDTVTNYGFVLKTNGPLAILQGVRIALNLFTLQQRSIDQERKLSQMVTQLRSLTHHLERSQEQRDVTLAGEIHDQLGQSLTSLDILLAITERELSQSTTSRGIAKRLAPSIAEARAIVAQTSNDVRRMMHELRPSVLEHNTIVDAIDWLVTQHDRFTVPQVRFYPPHCTSCMNDDHTLAAYRIVQEALTNALRHAGATSIDVYYECKDDTVEIRVVDDGRGIDEAELAQLGSSFGILGMRSRAEARGGSVTVEANSNGGTVVRLVLPHEKAGSSSV